ncbi:MAG: hypothetical protein NTY20_01460 [Candidatus Aenigmarchaeota archaeon]|nr:hypothetical protein [Candidatus Aenigmarchaeota archaeon]
MNIWRWQLLEYILGTVVDAKEIADAFQVPLTTAENRLKRAYRSGWLGREKYEGAYWYSLTEKAWAFWAECGESFTLNNPWFGWGVKKGP